MQSWMQSRQTRAASTCHYAMNERKMISLPPSRRCDPRKLGAVDHFMATKMSRDRTSPDADSTPGVLRRCQITGVAALCSALFALAIWEIRERFGTAVDREDSREHQYAANDLRR